jgi:hypothetical protein
MKDLDLLETSVNTYILHGVTSQETRILSNTTSHAWQLTSLFSAVPVKPYIRHPVLLKFGLTEQEKVVHANTYRTESGNDKNSLTSIYNAYGAH